MAGKVPKGKHSAHIKEHTKGTSNEISFSVLDAMRLTLEDKKSSGGLFSRRDGLLRFGFGRGKVQTPKRERGIHDASGKFVSTEGAEPKKSTPSNAKASKGKMIAMFGVFSGGTEHDTSSKLEKPSKAAPAPREKKQSEKKREKPKTEKPKAEKPKTEKQKSIPAGKKKKAEKTATLTSSHRPKSSASPSSVSAPTPLSRKENAAKATLSSSSPTPSPLPSKQSIPKRSPEEELARRKTMRRFRRTSMVVAAIIVCAVALALAGTYASKEIQRQNANVSKMEQALKLVEKADEEIRLINDLAAKPLSSGKDEERRKALLGKDAAVEKLEEARALAVGASTELRESQEKETANQVVVAVDARLNLIEEGSILIEEAQAAIQAAQAGQKAEAKLHEANERMDKATELALKDGEENYQNSTAQSEESIKLFEETQDLFSEFSRLYPEVDCTSYQTYCALAIEGQQHSIASNNALIERDKETALAENDAFNQAIAELTEVAEELKSPLHEKVKNNFDEKMKETKEKYEAAYLQASTADTFIREYLGL